MHRRVRKGSRAAWHCARMHRAIMQCVILHGTVSAENDCVISSCSVSYRMALCGQCHVQCDDGLQKW